VSFAFVVLPFTPDLSHEFRLTSAIRRPYNYTVILPEYFEEAKSMARSFRFGLAALALGAAAFVIAPAAHAQDAKSAKVKENKTEEGYGYTFDDDPLNAGGFGPNDATIRVRPKAARTTLIRPRTSFVPEMLKSVENI
jgi:hypothetical protein